MFDRKPQDEVDLPRDITRLTGVELSQMMYQSSIWASFYDTQATKARHVMALHELQYNDAYSSALSTSTQRDVASKKAAAESHSGDQKKAYLEKKLLYEKFQTMVRGYDRLFQTASRELTRRQGELSKLRD